MNFGLNFELFLAAILLDKPPKILRIAGIGLEIAALGVENGGMIIIARKSGAFAEIHAI